jgi:hypothetical protein
MFNNFHVLVNNGISKIFLLSLKVTNKFPTKFFFKNFLDSIRYGENLSLLFKCIAKQNDTDSLQMKHLYLSNDEAMKHKYVKIFFSKHINF